MLGLHDIQYLYEFIFWLVTFFILKKVWHKPKIRLFYGYSVATLNVAAVFFFSLASVQGEMPSLDAFSFGTKTIWAKLPAPWQKVVACRGTKCSK